MANLDDDRLVRRQFSFLFTRFVVLPDRVAVCPALGAPAAAMRALLTHVWALGF